MCKLITKIFIAYINTHSEKNSRNNRYLYIKYDGQ